MLQAQELYPKVGVLELWGLNGFRVLGLHQDLVLRVQGCRRASFWLGAS